MLELEGVEGMDGVVGKGGELATILRQSREEMKNYESNDASRSLATATACVLPSMWPKK